ncbi:MAG TPA: hypothetical protein PKJ84_00140, partial [Anaerolineales bacterium]|nr:hypothetical protein [Anaerolineales bacterium]
LKRFRQDSVNLRSAQIYLVQRIKPRPLGNLPDECALDPFRMEWAFPVGIGYFSGLILGSQYVC